MLLVVSKEGAAMRFRSVTPIRAAKVSYIVMSAVLCVIGILFMTRPRISATAMGYILGAALVIFGIAKMAGYFAKDLYRLAFQYDLETGIILLVLGIIILIFPGGMMNVISIALGVLILADGLFKIRIALDARRFGIERWWLTIVLAAAAILTGVVLVFQSARGAALLTVVLGAALLADGLLCLYVAATMVKIVANQYPDEVVIEVDGRAGHPGHRHV